MSRARPTERAADPALRATSNQVERAVLAPAAAATANAEAVGALAGARRCAAFVVFEVLFDLVVRARERAATLFAMAARLVAYASLAP